MAANHRRVFVVDSTLRDGAQQPGVVLTAGERVRLAAALDAAGVDELELGIPAMGAAECAAIRRCRRVLTHSLASVWCRARTDDIRLAAACEADAIHVSVPVSAVQLSAVGWRKEAMPAIAARMVETARQYGAHVRVGALDATRAEIDNVVALARAVGEAGAERIRLADTVGCAMPWQVAELVGRVVSQPHSPPVEWHGHNDLGMATANTLSAVHAGAAAVSCTVLGVGERAGNAALEEVVAALLSGGGAASTVIPSALPRLAGAVAPLFKVAIAPAKPVVGDAVFTHASGIHCHGMLHSESAFQPFAPSLVNAQPSYVIDTHSSVSTVRAALRTLGREVSPSAAARILSRAKRRIRRLGHGLSPADIAGLAA